MFQRKRRVRDAPSNHPLDVWGPLRLPGTPSTVGTEGAGPVGECCRPGRWQLIPWQGPLQALSGLHLNSGDAIGRRVPGTVVKPNPRVDPGPHEEQQQGDLGGVRGRPHLSGKVPGGGVAM